MNTRFLLLDEVQTCLWESSNAMPEVDIAIASVLDTFTTYNEATGAAMSLLDRIGAKPTFADVRPLEQCARCSSDFNTNAPHHTLVVSEEAGEETSPEIINVWYVARVCQDCGGVFEGRI